MEDDRIGDEELLVARRKVEAEQSSKKTMNTSDCQDR